MNRGWHVTAKQIQEWSATHTQEALGTLSLLARKLIVASIDFSQIHFPAGDSVFQSGWDGVLHARTGNAFVPSGESRWEFSIKRSIRKKANEVYNLRTSKCPAEVRATATFAANEPPLIAALMAGSWQADSPHDREAISRLAGTSYKETETDLEKWAICNDPPVRR